jgi:hypothetical protein
MANTRNRVTANNAENNGESNNQEANPPPPPPLTLEQVLAIQAQMLQTMQQTLVNLHAQLLLLQFDPCYYVALLFYSCTF